MKHKWLQPVKYMQVQECARCHATRSVLCTVPGKRTRALRTYMRADGIRFTGCAPECDAGMKQVGRPLVAEYRRWARLQVQIMGWQVARQIFSSARQKTVKFT